MRCILDEYLPGQRTSVSLYKDHSCHPCQIIIFFSLCFISFCCDVCVCVCVCVCMSLFMYLFYFYFFVANYTCLSAYVFHNKSKNSEKKHLNINLVQYSDLTGNYFI